MGNTKIEIIHENPFKDGEEAGKKRGVRQLKSEIEKILNGKYLKKSFGEMSRKSLFQYVMMRLETPPDYSKYPELEDLYPERVEYIRGIARGAECDLQIAAVWHYLRYREGIEAWWKCLNEPENEHGMMIYDSHCSGVLMIGPDGVIGGQSAESFPPVPKPRNYRYRPVRPFGIDKFLRPVYPDKLILIKPRTGYIINWGVSNEKGVACCCGNSCSVWLDEPIEDTWPVNDVPLLRFAANIEQLISLYKRYTLHNWGRASQIWADIHGDGIVVEKSFRRIGIRRIGKDGVLWCTEGHWQSDEMSAYIRRKRLEYLDKMGKHLGAGDMMYATDCAVRFTNIGYLCHLPLGKGIKHMSRVLSDHSTIPRAVLSLIHI